MLVVIHVLLHCRDLKIKILLPEDRFCGTVNEIVFRIFFYVDVNKDMKVISCCIFFFLTLEWMLASFRLVNDLCWERIFAYIVLNHDLAVFLLIDGLFFNLRSFAFLFLTFSI